MNILNRLICTTIIFGLASMATAHDDGLTCHTHPSSGHSRWITILSVSQPIHKPLMDAAIHSFDNEILKRPGEFSPEDVSRLRSALTELSQSVFIVLQIIQRSDHSPDRAESGGLLALARHAHDRFGLEPILTFRTLRRVANNKETLTLSYESVERHLSEKGIPSDLIVLFQDAAASC